MDVKIRITVDGEISRKIETTFETVEFYFGSSRYTEISDLREKELIKVLKKMHKISSITIDVVSCESVEPVAKFVSSQWKVKKAHRFICDYLVWKECEEDLMSETFLSFEKMKNQKGIFGLISKKILELNNFAFGLYLNEKLK